MSKELEDAIVRNYIERSDVKAIQRGDAYMPVVNSNDERLPWTRNDIKAHLDGRRSHGHYMVGLDGTAKLLAFDIDLDQTGVWVPIQEDGTWADVEPKACKPRDAWLHPKCPEELKRFLRAQLYETAQLICDMAFKLLPDVPTAVAYSGNKGLHVYMLTGKSDAGELREVGKEIMLSIGGLEPLRGENFYKSTNDDPKIGNGCVSTEIYPKQSSLDGKDLGNLMRLPLGVNAKSGQRSFFISLSNPTDAPFREIDPLAALKGNPWQ